MILSFTQTINGKPNFFIEKIWAGLTHHFPFKKTEWFLDYEEMFIKKFGHEWPCTPATLGLPPEKIHTIREDKNDRWHRGNKIHPVINNRTKNFFQFAPVIRCTGTQRILISYRSGKPEVVVDHNLIYYWDCEIENGYMELLELAKNDGFESVWDFFAYFNKDFTGKLIHWTDKRY